VNVVAISTPPDPRWRWRIVDQSGETLEESWNSFSTIALAVAAGRERLQIRRGGDRPVPAPAPWDRPTERP
jgi:hypothetical protein